MQQISPWGAVPQRRREDNALTWLQDTDLQARASLAKIAGETTDPRAWLSPADPSSSARDVVQIGAFDAVLPDAWLRLWKRAQLPEQLIAFQADLAAARTEEETCDTAARHAAQIVGAYQAMVLLPDRSEDGARTLRIAGWWSNGAAPRDVTLDQEVALRAPGLVDAGAVHGSGSLGLAPLASSPGVATLALVPLGEDGLLVLSERRAERIFTQDDWAVLDSLASQTGRALEQVRSLEEARSQALVDPLTGLANRRHMDVVLVHAWAAAERGDGLTVMMLDLDDFKGINDRHGHAVGDDVLRVVGEVLRTEIRGSDAVVRYGGDEFLVIMPRASADAARILFERVHRRLEGWVGVSAGIAAYHAAYRTADDLIAAADADLYQRKHSRPKLQPIA